ncbi:hypothetical protein F5Y07DRAFT_413547 [Xylaria sp. FL0933]|nr:hypothetical protein F5Y07DRAFT_413547 [Xylaria sp. FL0933]
MSSPWLIKGISRRSTVNQTMGSSWTTASSAEPTRANASGTIVNTDSRTSLQPSSTGSMLSASWKYMSGDLGGTNTSRPSAFDTLRSLPGLIEATASRTRRDHVTYMQTDQEYTAQDLMREAVHEWERIGPLLMSVRSLMGKMLNKRNSMIQTYIETLKRDEHNAGTTLAEMKVVVGRNYVCLESLQRPLEESKKIIQSMRSAITMLKNTISQSDETVGAIKRVEERRTTRHQLEIVEDQVKNSTDQFNALLLDFFEKYVKHITTELSDLRSRTDPICSLLGTDSSPDNEPQPRHSLNKVIRHLSTLAYQNAKPFKDVPGSYSTRHAFQDWLFERKSQFYGCGVDLELVKVCSYRNSKDYAYFCMGSGEVQSASGLVLALLEQLSDERAPFLSLRRRDALIKCHDVSPEAGFIKNDMIETFQDISDQQGVLKSPFEDALTNKPSDNPVGHNVNSETLARVSDINARAGEDSQQAYETDIAQEPITVAAGLTPKHQGTADHIQVKMQDPAARPLSHTSLQARTGLHHRVGEHHIASYNIPKARSGVFESKDGRNEAAENSSAPVPEGYLPGLQVLLDELRDRRNFRAYSTSQPFIVIIDAWDEDSMDSAIEFRRVIETLCSMPCKILLSSRARPNRINKPANSSVTEIGITRTSQAADVELCVEKMLLRKEPPLSNTHINSITRSILRSSESEFNLANILTQAVLRSDSQTVVQRLNESPIQKPFLTVLGFLNLGYLSEIIILWLLESDCPLTLEALQASLPILVKNTAALDHDFDGNTVTGAILGGQPPGGLLRAKSAVDRLLQDNPFLQHFAMWPTSIRRLDRLDKDKLNEARELVSTLFDLPECLLYAKQFYFYLKEESSRTTMEWDGFNRWMESINKLQLASNWGITHIVERILADSSALVTERDTRLSTSLHESAKGGFVDIVELLERKAPTDVPDSDGKIPINQVTGGSHSETKCISDEIVFSYCQERSGMHDSQQRIRAAELTMLRCICSDDERQDNIALFLLDRGTSPNCADENDTPALHLAVKHGKTDLLAALLEKGADASIITKEPLKESAKAVELLLNIGANVNCLNSKQRTPLFNALERGD